MFSRKGEISPAAVERDLVHPSDRVREAAVRELGRVDAGFPGLAEKLERAAVDMSPAVRIAAMYSILEQGLEPDLQETVLQALSDSHSRVREAAAIALSRVDDAIALERLDALLDDPDPALRHAALFSAAEKGFFQFRGRMERLLAQDPDDEVRLAAAAALGECRPLPREALLAAARQDESREVRFEAALALGRAGDVESVSLLAAFLTHEDLFTDAVECLCRLEGLKDPALLDAVQRLYGRPFQPVSQKLRLGALLCRLGDERARPLLERKVHAFFRETRVWAVYSLGLAGTLWAQEALQRVLQEHPGTQEAETAEDMLAKWEPARVFPGRKTP